MTKYDRAPQFDMRDGRRAFTHIVNQTGRSSIALKKTLNDIMGFDHVIYSYGDGRIADDIGACPVAPSLEDEGMNFAHQMNEDGSATAIVWELIGTSSQQGGGPIMHNSEFIGGDLADRIIDNAGFYVVLANTHLNEGCPVCGDPFDYCQGHGEIGDPRGFAIIGAHLKGEHDDCHDNAECQDAPVEGWAVAYRREP